METLHVNICDVCLSDNKIYLCEYLFGESHKKFVD